MKGDVEAVDLTGPGAINEAAGATRGIPGAGGARLRMELYRAEHSPIRARVWWLRLASIPSYVSTHLVRHKNGVEHFVRTKREDLSGVDPREVSRLSPVSHTMSANDAAIITMSRKRLCWAADQRTVAAWRRVRGEIERHDPDLARWMVPECCYRGGWCPEPRECSVGVDQVVAIYGLPGRGIGPSATKGWRLRLRRAATRLWRRVYQFTEGSK